MPVRMARHEEPLPGYRLMERLGRGGFGEVWKVEAPGGLHKAIKFVFGDLDAVDDSESRPAEQELKALNRVKSIRHPYILSLERIDRVDGQLMIVMELADRNLWDRFRESRNQGLVGIPRDELLRYMEESAEALDLMNNQYQIQHLDVKPQNIFLVHNHVKIADFGLAKDLEGDRATITGGVTPVYAAPETFEGKVSRFTDQYSLAIVYQELLTGVRPFNGQNTKQLLMQHLNGIPDLSSLEERDRSILERALSKQPEHRWPNCMDMVRALHHNDLLPGSGTIQRPTPRNLLETPRPGYLGNRSSGVMVHQTRRSPHGPTAQAPAPAMRSTDSPGLGLVTPRLVTPQNAGGGSGAIQMTLQRPQIFETGRMTTLGIASPEKTSDGVLFPAIMIAVGQSGLRMLRKLRQMIRTRYGSADALPTLRFLYVDTDPDAMSATAGPDGLPARNVVVAKLNRPSHYLQTSGMPSVESWLPPGILYRLPKSPAPTSGLRAFGRLALCDHYRLIAQRIRQEIETFLTDELLDRTSAETGLGFSTNRPRAYVLAGLGGGTGSGMAIDLSYILKHELKSVGYRKPESIGWFLLPPANENTAKTMALGNTFATLSEIQHYASTGRYQMKFDKNEPPVTDADGPFSRTVLLPLPKSAKARHEEKLYGMAARGLFTELFSAAGRVIDYTRSRCVPASDGRSMAQFIGMFRLAWPRPELVELSARRFVERIYAKWASKQAAEHGEPLDKWLDDSWVSQHLDHQYFFTYFDEVARQSLQDDPVSHFNTLANAARANAASRGRVDVNNLCTALDQILKLVGKPPADQEPPGKLEVDLQGARGTINSQLEKSVREMLQEFVELPYYRFAGADEIIKLLLDRVTLKYQTLDSSRAALSRQVTEIYGRLLQGIGSLGGSGFTGITARISVNSSDLLEQLKLYARERLRLIVMDVTLGVYNGLKESITEEARQMSHCRSRLVAHGRQLAGTVEVPDIGPGRLILPLDCSTLEDAADRFLDALMPEDFLAFDDSLQEMLKQQFRGLWKFCEAPPQRVEEFNKVLVSKAREFLNERFDDTDPASVLLRYLEDEDDVRRLIEYGAERAKPELSGLAGSMPRELCVLAAPEGPAGDHLRSLMAEHCQADEMASAQVPDDILIYRECPQVPLDQLPQMGQFGQQAYQGMMQTDHPPHTRGDIPWHS